jgi:hypothetical protein
VAAEPLDEGHELKITRRQRDWPRPCSLSL